MKVRFWGVRGSLPTPLTTLQVEEKIREALHGAAGVDLADRQAVESYVRSLPLHMRGTYGGNTPCLEVRNRANDLIVLDAGTGIRDLGRHLMRSEFGRGEGEGVVLFSHTHWDHIQGLPFFAPLFVPGNRFSFGGRHDLLEERLRYQHDPNFFPIGMDDFPASLSFHRLKEEQAFYNGRFLVKSIRQDHPGDSYAYRIEADGKSLVYATDAEYKLLTDEYVRPYIEFFRHANAVVFDAQFTLRETLNDKAEWGHSSAVIGIDLAMEAGVETLVLFHHDHYCTDRQINGIFDEALSYLRRVPGNGRLRVIVGYEGLELSL